MSDNNSKSNYFVPLRHDFDNCKSSFQYYYDVITRYYKHDIPDNWYNAFHEIMKMDESKFENYNYYSTVILSLQSLLMDSSCYTSYVKARTYFSGFILDSNHIVIKTMNPNVKIGYKLIKKDDVDVTTYLRSFIEYCRGHDIRTKMFYSIENLIWDDYAQNKLTFEYNGQIKDIINYNIYNYNLSKKYFLDETPDFVILNNIIKINIERRQKIYRVMFLISQNPSIDIIQLDLRTELDCNLFPLLRELNRSDNIIHFCNYYYTTNDKHNLLRQFIEKAETNMLRNIKEIQLIVGVETVGHLEHLAIAFQSLKDVVKVVIDFDNTSGAVGNTSRIYMKYGIYCDVNLDYVTYPNGEKIQKIGIRI